MFKSGFVAIIGEPNAGKSTLLNRWVGEPLAIVTPKAQTTRQQIRGIINRPNAQIIVVDTPGFHESPKAFNQYMIEQVKSAIKDVDVCCLLTEPVAELSALNQEMLKLAQEKRKPVIVAMNKMDSVIASEAKQPSLDCFGPKGLAMTPLIYPISALRGDGCDALLDAIVAQLPEGEALYPEDMYTEVSTRFIVSEMIRETLLDILHQELPYSAAVVVEEFTEKPAITVIKAAIIVEKDSQKAMVIGDKGGMIKKIGQTSRGKIEKFLDGKVFLELFVKVEKNWTKDPKKLDELGYG